MINQQEYELILSKITTMNSKQIDLAYELINEYKEFKKLESSFNLTPKQQAFINSECKETFYGGARGGGKSYATIVDAYLFAIKYPKSKQLILRRTFPELNRTLIPLSLTLIKEEDAKYTDKRWKFKNGSLIEFGYLDGENDWINYQGAEYDTIRFDELTNFTFTQYNKMIMCIRGINDYPKQIKCAGNPGGIGHTWVRERFIDDKIPLTIYTDDFKRTRQFIPAKVYDNVVLMEADPEYLLALQQLPEIERRAMLDGDWYAFEGQYFPEFNQSIHVIKPQELPQGKKFICLDYGLDMCAAYWIHETHKGKLYVYRELHEPNLNLTQAAKKIIEYSNKESISYITASPDLWNRRQETGKSGADIMTEAGLRGLVRANDSRIPGWRMLREYLSIYSDEQDILVSNLNIFNTCYNLVKCLPQLQHDKINTEDVADKPHAITHGPEALRYGVMSIQKSVVAGPRFVKLK